MGISMFPASLTLGQCVDVDWYYKLCNQGQWGNPIATLAHQLLTTGQAWANTSFEWVHDREPTDPSLRCRISGHETEVNRHDYMDITIRPTIENPATRRLEENKGGIPRVFSIQGPGAPSWRDLLSVVPGRYLVNHTKRQYLDTVPYQGRWYQAKQKRPHPFYGEHHDYHPLVALTLAPAAYQGPENDSIGAWRKDHLEAMHAIPDGYTPLLYFSTESPHPNGDTLWGDEWWVDAFDSLEVEDLYILFQETNQTPSSTTTISPSVPIFYRDEKEGVKILPLSRAPPPGFHMEAALSIPSTSDMSFPIITEEEYAKFEKEWKNIL